MLLLVLVLAVALSCVGAAWIARRYRRQMQQLMRAPHAGDLAVAADAPVPSPPPPAPASLAGNRAAGLRLSLTLIAVSCVIATSSASIWWTLSFPGEALAPKRVAVMALLHLWPVIPALSLLWRWSRTRLFGTLLLWCGLTFVVMLWRQIETRPLEAVAAMASEIGLPLMLVSLVFLGSATRAVAPWLLMPAALLMWSSFAGVNALMAMGERQSPLLVSLFERLDAVLGPAAAISVVPMLFAVLPWAFAWWPARMLGRALGRAYSRKWLSDLLVLFTGVWAFSLTDRALTINRAAAVALYVPLLSIPAVMWLVHRRRPHNQRPPTLLVLRVFQQDAQAQGLFDHVVERWRSSGNTVMIAGTDLADRTLDADDIFQFLDGQLARRFVSTPADVARRIAAFDMAPDIDGRHRVNEIYCRDTTWQDALQALVWCSDVVLMDLRGFQAHNAGCRYELATLATAPRALRVVGLTDDRTDRAAVQAALGSGRSDRFVWIDAPRFDAGTRCEVLARLFEEEHARAGLTRPGSAGGAAPPRRRGRPRAPA